MKPLANVLVPAWNEGNVIAGLLSRLAPASAEHRLRVIVIANACTDDTAQVARSTDAHAVVLETATPGKANAMNLGMQSAIPGIPVVCVDSDLIVTEDDIMALIAPLLDQSAMASCGRMTPDLTRSSALVRAYYRAWALNPYFARGKFGGLFALSAKGAARVFPLPAVTADDEWVRRSFSGDEIAFVETCQFQAKAPQDVATLIRLRRRALRGARAVRAQFGQTSSEGSVSSMLTAAVRQPGLWAPMALYIAIMTIVRLQLRFEPVSAHRRWERDVANRNAEVSST